MDNLEREIADAVRDARRRVWRRRAATIATIATFFSVAIIGTIVVFELFPEPKVSDYDLRRKDRGLRRDESIPAAIAGDYSAFQRDRSRMRWKALPVAGLAFASAYLVFKRLRLAE
jgi:hypothetical protein